MDYLPFDPNRALVLIGPTASGKSAIALRLAHELPSELICMDSMQVYREMAIGTSRPNAAELTEVPHHLFGSQSLAQRLDCARYTELAAQAAAKIQARERLPIFVGGTGLYHRALFEGLDETPPTPPELRDRLNAIAERHGREWLYKMLARLDPGGAERVHPNNSQRVQRYLEIRISGGRGVGQYWDSNRKPPKSLPLVIGLEIARQDLLNRIHARVEAMLAGGWIEETRTLMAGPYWDFLLAAGPIGYREIAQFLQGKMTKAELVEQIVIQTRRYAKRQMTWFRKVAHTRWFPFDPKSGYNMPAIIDFVLDRLG